MARNHKWTNVHGQREVISSEDLRQQYASAHMEQQAFWPFIICQTFIDCHTGKEERGEEDVTEKILVI